MDDSAELDRFEGTACLFPLPNVVLFPHVLLPLHIFEPRYRQMTEAALAGDRLIAMALLSPGWEADYQEKPALHPVVCLGKVVADQRLDDGRFNLLLRGLSRAKIVQELESGEMFRTARIELHSDVDLLTPHQTDALRTSLADEGSRWFKELGVGGEQLQKLMHSELTLGSFADVLSFALPLSIEFKQELLAELSVERRVQLLLRYLENTPLPEKSNTPSERGFPPDFSSN